MRVIRLGPLIQRLHRAKVMQIGSFARACSGEERRIVDSLIN